METEAFTPAELWIALLLQRLHQEAPGTPEPGAQSTGTGLVAPQVPLCPPCSAGSRWGGLCLAPTSAGKDGKSTEQRLCISLWKAGFEMWAPSREGQLALPLMNSAYSIFLLAVVLTLDDHLNNKISFVIGLSFYWLQVFTVCLYFCIMCYHAPSMTNQALLHELQIGLARC